MADPVPGTCITARNPNTNTNSSLNVVLPSTVVGVLNVIEISGYAQGTNINPVMATPSGWTKLGDIIDTTGTPTSWAGVYFRFYQSGDAGSVTFTWTNAGQMVAVATPYTGADPTTPIPYSVFDFKVASDTNYSIAGTTTVSGLLAYGFANRTGTAWTNTLDNARASVSNTSSCTMLCRVTASSLASGTAFTKTATGSNTSVGVSWAYTVQGPPPPPPPATSVDTWLASTPECAHRGGSADWVEHTLFAYAQSVAYGAKALEVSVWKTSDGVWVCSHDRTTDRVFGVSNDIPSVTWASIAGLRTTVGNHPIIRLQDVLNLYYKTHVIFIENKQGLNVTTFLDLLETYSTAHDRFVVKGYVGDTTAPTAKTRGFATWGYYYEADLPNLASTQDRWSILGMDYSASQSAWDTISGYGKPVLGHVILTAANATTAFSKGAEGLMTGKIVGVVPKRTDLYYAVWDGSNVEQPATIEGVWNGASVTPSTTTSIT